VTSGLQARLTAQFDGKSHKDSMTLQTPLKLIERNELTTQAIASPAQSKNFKLKKVKLDQFPDVSLYGANLYELYKLHGTNTGLNLESESGNIIKLTGAINVESLKRTTIYFRGKSNSIIINDLKNVHKLDMACADGSSISIKAPKTVRGMVLFSSHGGQIEIGADCMISQDVLIYASRAHGLYSVADGKRRYKDGVVVGDHVWLGKGTRILAGATVGDGSVIGSYSVLAGRVPNNCAAAGNPCRVTTKNIFWVSTPVADDGNYFEMLKKTGKPVPKFVRPTEDGH